MDLNFNEKKHAVRLSPRAYGDIEYKQRKNWNTKSREQRERAYLMFDRLHQALFNLANTNDFSTFSKNTNGAYQYTVTDGFAVIFFTLIKVNDSLIIYVTDFIWPYKKDPNSWWYIVEGKEQNLIRLTESQLDRLIETYVKTILQESSSKTEKKKYKGQKQLGNYTAIDGMWMIMRPKGLDIFGRIQDVRMYDNDLFKGTDHYETIVLFRHVESMTFFYAKIVPNKKSNIVNWAPIHVEEVPKIIVDDLKTINPKGHQPYHPH